MDPTKDKDGIIDHGDILGGCDDKDLANFHKAMAELAMNDGIPITTPLERSLLKSRRKPYFGANQFYVGVREGYLHPTQKQAPTGFYWKHRDNTWGLWPVDGEPPKYYGMF